MSSEAINQASYATPNNAERPANHTAAHSQYQTPPRREERNNTAGAILARLMDPSDYSPFFQVSNPGVVHARDSQTMGDPFYYASTLENEASDELQMTGSAQTRNSDMDTGITTATDSATVAPLYYNASNAPLYYVTNDYYQSPPDWELCANIAAQHRENDPNTAILPSYHDSHNKHQSEDHWVQEIDNQATDFSNQEQWPEQPFHNSYSTRQNPYRSELAHTYLTSVGDDKYSSQRPPPETHVNALYGFEHHFHHDLPDPDADNRFFSARLAECTRQLRHQRYLEDYCVSCQGLHHVVGNQCLRRRIFLQYGEIPQQDLVELVYQDPWWDRILRADGGRTDLMELVRNRAAKIMLLRDSEPLPPAERGPCRFGAIGERPPAARKTRDVWDSILADTLKARAEARHARQAR